MAEATTTAPEGSTEKVSTSDPLGIAKAIDAKPEPSPPAENNEYVKKLEKSLQDMKSTLGRNSDELGNLRKLAEQSSQTVEPEEKKISSLIYTDPEQYERLRLEEMEKQRADLKAEIMAEIEPELVPLRHATAENQLE